MFPIFIEFFSRIPVPVLIVLSAAGVIFGDFSGKTWASGGGSWWYASSFLGYLASAFFFTPTLLREGLVISSLMWIILSTAGFLIIGVGIFHEALSTWQMLGVALGVVSVVLLNL